MNKKNILILLDSSKDYDLLQNLLKNNYNILPIGEINANNQEIDLIIIDGINLKLHNDWILEKKNSVQPIFLPVLFITSNSNINVATSYLWKSIDEMIFIPVNKVELLARVEILLRTRSLSLELDKLHRKIEQENYEQLKFTLKASKIGIWDWDLITNKIKFSPEWKGQIGYNEDEIEDKITEWESRIHPKDLMNFKKYLYEFLINLSDNLYLEYRIRHKDGHYLNIYTYATLIYDENKKPIRIIGSQIDITEKIKAEGKIKLLSQVVDQAPLSILITDLNGRIEYVNKSLTEITGYTKSELIGKNPKIFKSGYHSIKFYKEMWETITAGKIWLGEIRNKKKNGELYWERALISPVINSDNEITNYFAIKEDITERKKNIDELIEARIKADENNNRKTSFMQRVFHEIRTPLNGILGFIEILKEPNITEEQREATFKVIEQSSKRILNTINDILEISKIEAGEINIKINEFRIDDLIQGHYEFYLPIITEKKLKFIKTIDLPEDKLTLCSDKYKIDTILTNLIDNAIKFTNSGQIEIGASFDNKDQNIIFFVKDTGVGIPEKRQRLIFEPFVKTEVSITTEYEGAGLGLSICSAYIKLLKGKIWVESTPDFGSSFYFTIPYSKTKSACEKVIDKTLDTISYSLENKTILIAEDDKNSYAVLERILKPRGAKLLRAINGLEVLDILKQNPNIDLILMDLKMPVMDGLEATKKIREFNKNIPIIAETAHAFSIEKDKALEAGCSDHIPKPINKIDLLKLLKKYI